MTETGNGFKRAERTMTGMEPGHLDAWLDENLLDAYLVDGSTADSDCHYLTGLPDVVGERIAVRHDGETTLIVPSFDYDRAVEQAEQADRVADSDTYGDRAVTGDVIDAYLEEHGIDHIAVPTSFPYRTGKTLEGRHYHISTVEGALAQDRAVKTDTEVDALRTAQQGAVAGMEQVKEMLEDAEARHDILLYDGEPLTTERVKRAVREVLNEQDCTTDQFIVACGPRSADPHWRGEGVLQPDRPIVVDIFPEHSSGYHGDLSRTFVVGANETVADMHDATLDAMDAAYDALEQGERSTAAIHDAVCDVYEEAGYPTTRDDAGEGFIHSTGHGIGLDVHEQPGIPSDWELEPGNVVTIEPGLYFPDVGGVRIEDTVLITEDGYEILVDHPKTLHR